tara:strand:- start:8107 stop:8247 length:141 start_codon:yes stop_codon:yes gene_type:complete
MFILGPKLLDLKAFFSLFLYFGFGSILVAQDSSNFATIGEMSRASY